jgi:hypothetical protein
LSGGDGKFALLLPSSNDPWIFIIVKEGPVHTSMMELAKSCGELALIPKADYLLPEGLRQTHHWLLADKPDIGNCLFVPDQDATAVDADVLVPSTRRGYASQILRP